jgi:ribose 5-phosphate isomerase B
MTMKVYFASDHAGFDAKNELVEYVRDQLKCDVEDCGALMNDPQDDYPGLIAVAAKKLSEDVAAGIDSRAIVAGASGQGEAIVANRFKGVRCALYYGDPGNQQVDASGKQLDILMSTREHNDANALSLGLRFLTLDQAKHAVARWLRRRTAKAASSVHHLWCPIGFHCCSECRELWRRCGMHDTRAGFRLSDCLARKTPIAEGRTWLHWSLVALLLERKS